MGHKESNQTNKQTRTIKTVILFRQGLTFALIFKRLKQFFAVARINVCYNVSFYISTIGDIVLSFHLILYLAESNIYNGNNMCQN